MSIEEIQMQIGLWQEAMLDFARSHPEEMSVGLLVSVASTLLVVLLSLRAHSRLTRKNRELATVLEALRSGVEVPAQPEDAQPVARPVEEIVPLGTEAPGAPAEIEIPAETPRAAIARGLTKSRMGLLGRLASVLSGKPSLDLSMLDDLEEALILSDVGARCAADLISTVRTDVERESVVSPGHLKSLLKEGILERLVPAPADHRLYHPIGGPLVVLVVGVNGVGKTTTVAKLASRYIAEHKRVLVIAADTFRAAAVEQLSEWSRRVGFTLVKGPEGAKPGAVVFDGMAAATSGEFDVVLIDTAGRLHTKSNLMQELEGIRNSIKKHIPDAPHETVLVVDGVSGQNALVQAREFNSAVPLSGVVVTKLDGTPKGGIIVAISHELRVPVLFVGVGEKDRDLLQFDRVAFVEALFEEASNSERGAKGADAVDQSGHNSRFVAGV